MKPPVRNNVRHGNQPSPPPNPDQSMLPIFAKSDLIPGTQVGNAANRDHMEHLANALRETKDEIEPMMDYSEANVPEEND